MNGSLFISAVDHLKTHPELHKTASRQLERVVKDVKASCHTWNRAKRELGIEPLPRYYNQVRRPRPNKQEKGTLTVTLDVLNGKVNVESADGDKETHRVNHLTMDFLAWVLEVKHYTYRHVKYGAVFSRTERV